jgi:hypothetical protein
LGALGYEPTPERAPQRQRHRRKPAHPRRSNSIPAFDPRIKKYFAGMPRGVEKPNVSSREELLAQENSPAALTALARQTGLFDSMDSEEVAPSAGLSVRTETLTSSPDGNTNQYPVHQAG